MTARLAAAGVLVCGLGVKTRTLRALDPPDFRGVALMFCGRMTPTLALAPHRGREQKVTSSPGTGEDVTQ
jgi:hypothetical protein